MEVAQERALLYQWWYKEQEMAQEWTLPHVSTSNTSIEPGSDIFRAERIMPQELFSICINMLVTSNSNPRCGWVCHWFELSSILHQASPSRNEPLRRTHFLISLSTSMTLALIHAGNSLRSRKVLKRHRNVRTAINSRYGYLITFV